MNDSILILDELVKLHSIVVVAGGLFGLTEDVTITIIATVSQEHLPQASPTDCIFFGALIVMVTEKERTFTVSKSFASGGPSWQLKRKCTADRSVSTCC